MERSLLRPLRRIALSCLVAALLALEVVSTPPQALAADCNGNGVPDEREALPLVIGSVVQESLPGAAGKAAIGDLDGDGRPDLAVATLQPGELGVTVLVDPGSGAAGTPNSLANPALGLDCGDLDGDGDLDLALARATDIRTFLNAGDGTFPTRSFVAQTGSFADVRIGDLDKDGVNDVVASRSDRGVVVVFRGTGAGQFATPVEVATESPGALSLIDFDGDGDLDVVVVMGQGTIGVLQNRGAAGLAAPATISAAGTGLLSLASSDLDGDGLPDLAAIDASRLLVLSNRGGGTFEHQATYVAEAGVVLRAVAIGDPDGDGLREIVIGRTGAAGTEELQLIRVVDGGGLEPTMPIGIANRPGSVHLVDLDGDGTDELVVPAAGAPEVAIVRRRGDQSSPTSPLTFRSASLSIEQFGKFEPHTSFLADLDGDGLLDLTTMDGEDRVMVLRNLGDGTQGDETIYTLRDATELISLAPADLDRDGDIDIAAVDEFANYLLILINQGDGTFSQTATSYKTDLRPYFVIAVDLDKDSDLDIVCANERAATIGIFRNRGSASFEDQESIPVGSGPVGLVAADFDGDGYPDLAVGKNGASKVAILRNDKQGHVSERVDYDAGKVSYVCGADLDGDGDIDIVAARESENRLTILRNDGGGAFEAEEAIDIGRPPRSVIAPNLDGDGLPDLVTGDEDTNSMTILRSLGGGQFGGPAHYPVGAAPRFVVSGDLDRDGDIDLVVANHSSYDLTFFFSETSTPAPVEPLERICTELDYFTLARPVASGELAELDVRYLVPAREGDPQLLPAQFLPTADGRSTWQTLADSFPAKFEGLTEDGYLGLVARRATRQYFAGSVLRLRLPGRIAYGFTIVTDAAANPGERVSAAEAASVYRALAAAFLLDPLAYYPDTAEGRADARTWGDPGFPMLIRDPPLPFRRGDSQADGIVNIADTIAVLEYLFRGGTVVACADAADANDDGSVDLSDAVTILRYLFSSHNNLPAPAGTCGLDPSDDELPCGAFPPCE